jgi:hypothetical protein
MNVKPHGIYSGVEYITGLGQYRMGYGEIVTAWHDTLAEAFAEFCTLSEARDDVEAQRSLADLEQART